MGLTQVSTDGVKNDAITKTKIPANQIEASELADNAVDTNAIQGNAVTSGKLADGAVTNGKLGSEVVTNIKVADNAINEQKLQVSNSPSNGYFLSAQSGNTGGLTWAQVSGTTINNNADNRVITGSGTANTLEGEANLTFDGTTLNLPNANQFITGGGHNIVQVDTTKTYLYGGTGGVQFRTADNSAELINITNAGSLQLASGGYNGGGANPAFYISNTSGRQAKIHSPNNSTSALQITNNVTGQGDDNGMMFATLSTGEGWICNAENQAIRFGTNNAERLRIQNGGGISFNGDTSSNNALNDYEEGTWTPNMFGNGSGSYTVRNGNYTKIGDIVHLHFYIDFYNGNAAGGNAFIMYGLPFTSTGLHAGSVMFKYHNSNNNRYYVLHIGSNVNYITAYGSENNANWEALTADSTFEMIGSITYRTNS